MFGHRKLSVLIAVHARCVRLCMFVSVLNSCISHAVPNIPKNSLWLQCQCAAQIMYWKHKLQACIILLHFPIFYLFLLTTYSQTLTSSPVRALREIPIAWEMCKKLTAQISIYMYKQQKRQINPMFVLTDAHKMMTASWRYIMWCRHMMC